jgi:hypothetical protein
LDLLVRAVEAVAPTMLVHIAVINVVAELYITQNVPQGIHKSMVALETLHGHLDVVVVVILLVLAAIWLGK